MKGGRLIRVDEGQDGNEEGSEEGYRPTNNQITWCSKVMKGNV